MKQAMQASGARSKREAMELELRTLVKLQQQERGPAGRQRHPAGASGCHHRGNGRGGRHCLDVLPRGVG